MTSAQVRVRGLTCAVAVLFHVPHGALVVAPRQLLANHLQLPKAPVREVRPTQLENRGKGCDQEAPALAHPSGKGTPARWIAVSRPGVPLGASVRAWL